MAYGANQKKIGTQRGESEPTEVKRSGRDSFLKRSGSVGHPHEDSSPDVARAGRKSGTGQVSPDLGIGRGGADQGEGGVSRIPDDISSV